MGALPSDVPLKSPSVFQHSPTDRSLHGDQHTTFETSLDLQRLFLEYPRLRAQLKEVYVATNEPLENSNDEKSRESHGFRRGSSRGYRVNKSQQSRKSTPWAQRKGFILGLRRFQKLQAARGLEGEGLKEFSKLMLNTVERSEQSL